MKNITLTLSVLFLFFTGCSVDQTEQGDLPEVEVDTEEGNIPEYDVNWANVDVSTETEMVEVPKVVVVMEEEEVEVPSISMNIPDHDAETVKRDLVVQAEVTGTEKSIEIQQIKASKNLLIVIATLEDLGNNLGDQTMRVQDQVKLNAPEDLNVKYYIIGNKPDRVFNNQYTYVGSMDALPSNFKNARTIFEK